MPKALSFFRGRMVPLEEANVNIMTHALHYGTAVFEGIRGNWNEQQGKVFIFRMREHYERLHQGCRIMMLKIPYLVDDLCRITEDLVRNCGYRQDVYIRPLAYKSAERVANLKLHELDSDFALIVVPFGAYLSTDGAIKCCTSSWRRIDDTIIPPRVKIAGHYVNSILAKTEAILGGYDEAIMLNQDGSVSEGSGENVFMVSGGVLYTPNVGDNNLTGITRDSVFQLAEKELKLKVMERHIRRSELYLADEVFLTGTAAHITPVGHIDHRPIASGNVGPITKKLQDIYMGAVRGNNPKYLNWCSPVALETW
jgi:branched-chain amino acid aminotransferase